MKYYPTFKAIWGIEENDYDEDYNISRVEEEKAEYAIEQEHDKIFRTLLDNKKEAMRFINKTLKTKFIEEELEKYNSSFVNKIFQNREADVVYKLKDKNIFILLEHQTKIDFSMAYRILEYQMAIIKSAVDEKRLKTKDYKLPLVIPIVIYVGKQKWNANKYIEESQEKLEGVKSNLSNYNLVDVNNFTEKELIEDETLISKIMLIQKTKDSQEVVRYIEKIIPKIKEEEKDLMARMITMIFEEKIGKEKANELIKKLKGEDKEMLPVIEMIRKENQMYIDMGRKKEKQNIIKNMLIKKIPINIISEITKVSEKEIEKIKNN